MPISSIVPVSPSLPTRPRVVGAVVAPSTTPAEPSRSAARCRIIHFMTTPLLQEDGESKRRRAAPETGEALQRRRPLDEQESHRGPAKMRGLAAGVGAAEQH